MRTHTRASNSYPSWFISSWNSVWVSFANCKAQFNWKLFYFRNFPYHLSCFFILKEKSFNRIKKKLTNRIINSVFNELTYFTIVKETKCKWTNEWKRFQMKKSAWDENTLSIKFHFNNHGSKNADLFYIQQPISHHVNSTWSLLSGYYVWIKDHIYSGKVVLDSMICKLMNSGLKRRGKKTKEHRIKFQSVSMTCEFWAFDLKMAEQSEKEAISNHRVEPKTTKANSSKRVEG